MDAWRTVVQRRMAVHTHPIDLVREEGALRRDAKWIGVLYRHERRVFDSRSVSLELKSERATRWLVGLVRTAIEANAFAPPPGANVTVTHRAPISWRRHTPGKDDDCVCELGAFSAHVENTPGPHGKGGRYHVGVYRRDGDDLCDLRDVTDIEARSGEAGRFLAELVLDLASGGHAIPTL